MGALKLLRTNIVEEPQFTIDINGNRVFLNGSVVALLAIEIISMILFRAKQSDMKATYFQVLIFSDIFLAFINPFMLLMLLEDYQNHEWISRLFFYAIVALVVGYAGYSDENVNNNSFAPDCTYLGLFMVPLLLVLVHTNWMPPNNTRTSRIIQWQCLLLCIYYVL